MKSLAESAEQFRTILDGHRKSADSVDFEWYPYDSLSNVRHLEALIGEPDGYVMESAREERILDIGCGDGDIGFFLNRWVAA